MSTRAIVVTLPDGPQVIVAQLTPSELITSMKLAGAERVEMVRGVRVTRSGLQMSIRKIDEKVVTFADLQGAGWAKHLPHERSFWQLVEHWSLLHIPTAEGTDAMKAAMVPTVGGDGELWTIPLPQPARKGKPQPDLIVGMIEAPAGGGTVEAALREAAAESKSEAAQSFASTIASARRTIRFVNGTPVTASDLEGPGWDARFTVHDTYLLGTAFAIISTGAGSVATMGEIELD